MSSIQRYDIYAVNHGGMVEVPETEGPWVLYSDHAALLAAKDEEIGRLKSAIQARADALCLDPYSFKSKYGLDEQASEHVSVRHADRLLANALKE